MFDIEPYGWGTLARAVELEPVEREELELPPLAERLERERQEWAEFERRRASWSESA